MLERSVACSDLSSLHSYFSTGIVRLMSPLHNRCHLSVRLRAVQNLRGFSGYDCKTEQGTDVGNSFFRQAFDTLSKARQGRVGRTNGDNCLSFIEERWLFSIREKVKRELPSSALVRHRTLHCLVKTAYAQPESQAVELPPQPGRRLQFDCLRAIAVGSFRSNEPRRSRD